MGSKKTSDIFGQKDQLAENEANRATAAKAWGQYHDANLRSPAPQGLFNRLKRGINDKAQELKLDWNEIGTSEHPSAFSADPAEARRQVLLQKMREVLNAGQTPSEDLNNEWQLLLKSGEY